MCIRYIAYACLINRVSDPHFFADPDPGKNLHADPDPRGIRGVKGKNDFFSFFHVSDDSEQLLKKFEKEFMKNFSAPNCLKRMINTKKIC